MRSIRPSVKRLAAEADDEPFITRWFCNHYECSNCGTRWDILWPAWCADRCASCGTEIEPTQPVRS